MTKITLFDLFEKADNLDPENWDISWIQSITIPDDGVVNRATAIKLVTQTARAVDWCSEKISILTRNVEESKDEYKAEHARANLNSTEKSAAQKKVWADQDPGFLAKKSHYNKLLSYLRWFQGKHDSFITAHHALKMLLNIDQKGYDLSGHPTGDEAYEETFQIKTSTSNDEEGDDPEPDFD